MIIYIKDQGDPNQIYADMGDEDGYYVKMQKDDGSYNYVPMGREGHGLYMYMKGRKYINLDKQEDEAGYYVKMRNSDGFASHLRALAPMGRDSQGEGTSEGMPHSLLLGLNLPMVSSRCSLENQSP